MPTWISEKCSGVVALRLEDRSIISIWELSSIPKSSSVDNSGVIFWNKKNKNGKINNLFINSNSLLFLELL